MLFDTSSAWGGTSWGQRAGRDIKTPQRAGYNNSKGGGARQKDIWAQYQYWDCQIRKVVVGRMCLRLETLPDLVT